MVTKTSDLEAMVKMANDATDGAYDFGIDHNIGGWRMTAKGGSVYVGPRLPKKAFYDWLTAFVFGLDYANKPGYIATSV